MSGRCLRHTSEPPFNRVREHATPCGLVTAARDFLCLCHRSEPGVQHEDSRRLRDDLRLSAADADDRWCWASHFTRASDVIVPDYLTTSPSVPITPYRDSFGNWCSRIVAPAGRVRLAADGIVRDSGLPDASSPRRRSMRCEDLPAETMVYLLGSRYCETDRLSEIAWKLFEKTAAGLGAGSGDLRLRPPPHRVRLRACPRDQDGVGGVQRAAAASAATTRISPSRSAAA